MPSPWCTWQLEEYRVPVANFLLVLSQFTQAVWKNVKSLLGRITAVVTYSIDVQCTPWPPRCHTENDCIAL